MAADGMSWYFQLVDRISGPAKDATRSLSSVNDSLKSVDKATNGGGLVKIGAAIRQAFGADAEGAFYKGASGIAGMLSKVDKIIPLDALKAIGGFATAAAGELLSVVAKLAEVAGVVAIAAAGLVFAGFKFAAESADFKRNTIIGLQTMLGAGADARDTLDTLEGYAKSTGLQKDAFTGFARSLLGAGFNRDELKPLLAAISDTQAANGGDVAKAQELMAQFERIKSLDKVSSRELVAFGGLGISSDKIYAALAEAKGVTLQQAKALFDSGDLKSQDALNAILKSIQTNFDGGNKLGTKGLEFEAGSLTAQVQHLKDAWGDLFENVNTKPLVDFIHNIVTALQGPAGAKFTAAINKAFDAVSKLFGVSGDDLDATINKIADGFSKVVDWAIDFGTSVGKTWDEIKGPLGQLWDSVDRIVKAPENQVAWDAFLFNLKLLAAWGIGTIELYAEIAELPQKMVQVGADIVGGLWEGITSGWDAMLDKFHALVELLPAAAKKILGIASPSKVFAELGMQTGAGFSVGLDASDVPSSINAAIAPPRSPSLASFTQAGGYAGAGGRGTVIELHIHVTRADDEDMAKQIAEQVQQHALPSLVRALEQLNAESGG
jgi:phage-related protein